MKPAISGLLAATVFVLSGCLSGSDSNGGNSNGKTLAEFDVKVISIDHEAGIIVTESETYECVEGVAEKSVERDTAQYALENGQLFLIDEEECAATLLTGNSSTIIGTWKGSFATQEAIPEKYRPEDCDESVDTIGLGTVENVFENLEMTYEVNTKSVKSTISGTVCVGDFLAEMFVQQLDEFTEGTSSPITIKEKSCSKAVLENKMTKETAQVSGTFDKSGINMKFAYKDKTCSGVSLLPMPGTVPDCSIEGETIFQEFALCVFGSGFLIGQ